MHESVCFSLRKILAQKKVTDSFSKLSFTVLFLFTTQQQKCAKRNCFRYTQTIWIQINMHGKDM